MTNANSSCSRSCVTSCPCWQSFSAPRLVPQTPRRCVSCFLLLPWPAARFAACHFSLWSKEGGFLRQHQLGTLCIQPSICLTVPFPGGNHCNLTSIINHPMSDQRTCFPMSVRGAGAKTELAPKVKADREMSEDDLLCSVQQSSLRPPPVFVRLKSTSLSCNSFKLSLQPLPLQEGHLENLLHEDPTESLDFNNSISPLLSQLQQLNPSSTVSA